MAGSSAARGVCLLLFIVATATSITLVDAASFVTRSGNQLLLDGKPFYHMGFNAVWMPSSASYNVKQHVDDTLDAAQRIGLKALRVWGFNSNFPSAPGQYSDQQGQGLDYVIAGAAKRGLRVELALANFWNAYHSPEKWLMMAYGDMNGQTIADFYRSDKVLLLLKDHIFAMTSRVNTLTGVAYKDNPTIMGYNLFNEPRCPGCTAGDMAARNSFISALADTLRVAAPKQLTFSGTEGFFAAGDPNVGYNPGRGAQCEGDDWTQEVKLFDVATVHVYWRQMELLKQTGWKRPGFEFHIQYLHHKLKLYTEVAEQAGKPLVLEEFGLTKRFFTLSETKVVFAVVADAMIAAKRAGKPFMGAWLWQAAPIGEEDYGGYDVILTKALSGATIGLGNPPLRSGTDKSGDQLALPEERWQAGFRDGGASSFTSPCEGGSGSNSTSSSSSGSTGTNAATTGGSSGGSSSGSDGASSSASNSATDGNAKPTTTSNPATSSSSSSTNATSSDSSSTSSSNTATGSSSSSSSSSGADGGTPNPASPTPAPTVTAFNTSPISPTTNNSPSSSGSVVGTERAVVGRRMLDTQVKIKASDDQLDYFRQGAKRMACSDAVNDWPEKTIPFVLDVQAYYDMVKNHEIVDILAEAARLLNE